MTDGTPGDGLDERTSMGIPVQDPFEAVVVEKDWQELQSLLLKHDWYFDFSDDVDVYRAGYERWKEINRLARKIGPKAQRLVRAHQDVHFNPATGCSWDEEATI